MTAGSSGHAADDEKSQPLDNHSADSIDSTPQIAFFAGEAAEKY